MYSQLLLRPLGVLKSVNTEASDFTTGWPVSTPPGPHALLEFLCPGVWARPVTRLILSVIQVTGPALRRPRSFCLYSLGDPKPLGKKSYSLAGETTQRGCLEREKS